MIQNYNENITRLVVTGVNSLSNVVSAVLSSPVLVSTSFSCPDNVVITERKKAQQ